MPMDFSMISIEVRCDIYACRDLALLNLMYPGAEHETATIPHNPIIEIELSISFNNESVNRAC